MFRAVLLAWVVAIVDALMRTRMLWSVECVCVCVFWVPIWQQSTQCPRGTRLSEYFPISTLTNHA